MSREDCPSDMSQTGKVTHKVILNCFFGIQASDDSSHLKAQVLLPETSGWQILTP